MERNIAVLAGTIVGILFPVIVGFIISVVLTKRRDDFKVTAWPTVIGIILTFAGCAGALNRTKRADEIVVDREVVGKAQKIFYPIDPAALVRYSKETKESVAKALREQGEQVDLARVTATSIQPAFQGIPLAAVRTEVSVPDKLFMYEFIGPSGPDMIRLTCSSPSAERFEVDFRNSADKCGQSVMQTFVAARRDPLSFTPPEKKPTIQSGKRP